MGLKNKVLKLNSRKALQSSTSTPPLSPIPYPSLPQPPLTSLTPLPTLTLSHHNHHHHHLLHFLNTHLTQPFTPTHLLHFLKSKLHHHPSFTHYDFHIFHWASTIDSFRHDHSTFEWMARTLAITHRFLDLTSLLQFMASNPCPCSDGIFSCSRTEPIFRFSINAYCRVGKLDDAVVAFECMKKLIDGRPSVALYNILIHGFVKCGEHCKALQVYDKMIKDRVKPDVYTFNILISSYCRNKRFGLALELFKEMREKGCSPNVVSFNTLIRGFFRERKFDEGIAMAYEMVELGCEFSRVTCEILVDGLCRDGRDSEACELLIDFSRRGVLPDGYDYYGLMEVLCGKGNAGRALEVVDELWRKGNVPSLIACTTLIEGLRRLGRIDEAFRLTERMLRGSLVPDSVTFNCVLQGLCDVGRTVEANRLRLLASSKGLDSDGMAYGILVSGYTREGKQKDGEVVVDEMLDRGFIPNITTYNRLMDGLANARSSVRHQANVIDLLKDPLGNDQKEVDIEGFKLALSHVDSQMKSLPTTAPVATFNRAHIFPGALTARFSLKRRVLGVLEVLAVIRISSFPVSTTDLNTVTYRETCRCGDALASKAIHSMEPMRILGPGSSTLLPQRPIPPSQTAQSYSVTTATSAVLRHCSWTPACFLAQNVQQ
uniref:Pentacotripeptide-repeat region of PRORP domain-containing protein n=1 Tax=Fagus sylvatica TaxID=28930 RepID=A0A2N9HWC1_FAGSY